MQKLIDWMNSTVAPKLEKISQNHYISALQQSIMKTLPMILVSSVVTVYSQLRKHIVTLPNLSPISSYSFGLISIFIAFMLPFYILENKKIHRTKFVAGFTGISLFMLFVNPKISAAGYLYNFTSFGAGGMFVAIVVGLMVGFVFSMFKKSSFFKEDSVIPDFVKEWFDSMIPIALILLLGWFVVIQSKFDAYSFIVATFMPLVHIMQSPFGFVIIYFIPTVFYSMGISGWVFTPILNPVFLTAIAANAAAVTAGATATYIATSETLYAYLSLGGRGATLPLAFLLLFSASKKLKALGKASLVPSLLNINEPVVFGTIAWNPILMIPMWIIALVLPLITYVTLSLGWFPIPASAFTMWYMPIGLSAFVMTGDFRSLILVVINLGVALAIWYPFFRIYEGREVKKEQDLISNKVE